MWTKRRLIEEAYGELALAGYTFDLTPEEMQTALRRMDTMVATWVGKGIEIPYQFGPDVENSDLDDPSGIALVDCEAVYLNLAVRLSAGVGKQAAPSTKAAAKDAYDALMTRQAILQLQQQQLPSGVPSGAGHRSFGGYPAPFLPSPDTSPVVLGDDGLEFLGG